MNATRETSVIIQLITAPPNVYFFKQIVDYAYECASAGEEMGSSAYIYSRADTNEVVMERKKQSLFAENL
jgi:hypothetical protein